MDLCPLTLLLFDRACNILTFTQSMVTSQIISQGMHHVRKSSRPSPSVFHLRIKLLARANAFGGGRRPGFEAMHIIRAIIL